MDIQIRQLESQDAAAFQSLKLRGLQESPFAFSDSYEDELRKNQEFYQMEFNQFVGDPEKFILGAFDSKDKLKGYVIFKRDGRSNSRHKSMIHNMYTHPDIRGKGIGKELMNEVLKRAQKMMGLEQVHLWVLHSENISASDFYLKLGFERQGPYVKKDQKILGRYVDAEYMVKYL